MPTAAIDFETTYTSIRDIKTLGVAAYVEHPDTDIYLVSVFGPGVEYVGRPENAPWALIDGWHWVSHNAAFDAYVFMELKRRALIGPDLGPSEWDCTANMAAFLNSKRDLKSSSFHLLGYEISKEVRDEMKGKTWEQMTPEFRQKAMDYALDDAALCYELWAKHSKDWPEQERRLSRHTLTMCLRGVAIDLVKCAEWIKVAERALARYESMIPWVGSLDSKGKPVSTQSRHALKRQCIAQGVPPPSTTADKSPIYDAWLEEWGAQVPWVDAYKNYGYVNRVLEILYSIRDHTSYDGRLRYSLKYFGAHTGRWSGAGGINFQNFPRDPLCFDVEFGLLWDDDTLGKAVKRAAYAIDLRNLVIAGPGKKLLIGDLCQIEAVVAMWLAEDWTQLALIAQGMDCYEAHARVAMNYTDARTLKDYVHDPACPPEHKNLRQFAKCRRLGLQFGLGPKKFIQIVREWAKINITAAESKRIVDDFRAKERGIVEQWNALERALRIHIANTPDVPFEIELSSWRSLRYFGCSRADGISGFPVRGDMASGLYGGFLFQNATQATARDVIGCAILEAEETVGEVQLHVHDEVVVEVDEDVPCSALQQVMERDLDWAPGMPVRAEVNESKYYRKF